MYKPELSFMWGYVYLYGHIPRTLVRVSMCNDVARFLNEKRCKQTRKKRRKGKKESE